MGDPAPKPVKSDFYVGYLAASPAVKRLARFCALVPAVALLALAAALATSRRDPGRGSWDTASVRTFTGVVQAAPYPMIHLTKPSGPLPIGTTLLIVEIGKYGGGKRALPLDGHLATLSGYLLERDGGRMVELEAGDQALVDLNQSHPFPLDIEVGQAAFQGEIVDSKCYLGAMKPGDGHVHRECAMLCVLGGIPPTLVATDRQGNPLKIVLADESGRAMSSEIVPLIALPVSVQGTLYQRNGILLLRTRPELITSLGNADQHRHKPADSNQPTR